MSHFVPICLILKTSHISVDNLPSAGTEEPADPPPYRGIKSSPPAGPNPPSFFSQTTHFPPLHSPFKTLEYLVKMAVHIAQKRLFHEYKNLSTNPPEGITAGPVSEDDMFYWEALIQGPEGTPFEGGVFAAELKFPKDYPLSPPTMKFVGGGVWHPNGTFRPKTSTSFHYRARTNKTFILQSTPMAQFVSPFFTLPATTQTTTNTPRSVGRPFRAWRRFLFLS